MPRRPPREPRAEPLRALMLTPDEAVNLYSAWSQAGQEHIDEEPTLVPKMKRIKQWIAKHRHR